MKLSQKDIQSITKALKLIDLDVEAARGLLEFLRDKGVGVQDAKSAITTASTLLERASDWEDLGEILPPSKK